MNIIKTTSNKIIYSQIIFLLAFPLHPNVEVGARVSAMAVHPCSNKMIQQFRVSMYNKVLLGLDSSNLVRVAHLKMFYQTG